jgi:hypothetical protein
LTIKQILAWADAHHQRTGKWPNGNAGRVYDAPSETWTAINAALRDGFRGLAGGITLVGLLVERRGIRSQLALPKLTIKQILAWADAHYQRAGKWPNQTSGPVYEHPAENWAAIQAALRNGFRGLPRGSSVSQMLAKYRGMRNPRGLPKLSIRSILAWMDAHRERTGRWPTARSGPVEGSDGETWRAINRALVSGTRGLRGGSSLAQLRERHWHVRNKVTLPPLTIRQVLRWADAHHRRTGRWPMVRSGPVRDAPGEKWNAINSALHGGNRGLPSGLSLNLLLARHRGTHRKVYLPRLTIPQILTWADEHYRRTGRWPNRRNHVRRVPGATWGAINHALCDGYHGLPGGTSLRQLLVKHGRIKEGR